MITLAKRIENLKANISNARQAAQYAEGRAYYDEMRQVALMEQNLAKLQKELADAGTNETN
jgi:hypothetical protein